MCRPIPVLKAEGRTAWWWQPRTLLVPHRGAVMPGVLVTPIQGVWLPAGNPEDVGVTHLPAPGQWWLSAVVTVVVVIDDPNRLPVVWADQLGGEPVWWQPDPTPAELTQDT